MDTLSLTIKGGVDKSGNPDILNDIEIERGEIIGIVGPTGSGKSTLIGDIEQLAQSDTPSGRRILLNGQVPDKQLRTDPRKKLIALDKIISHIFYISYSLLRFSLIADNE